jgi:hypothetical protein
MISESFLWLWKIKELIDDRPSMVPVGLGNNESEIDMFSYLPGTDDGQDFETSEGGLEEEGDDDLEQIFDGTEVKGEDDCMPMARGRKRKVDPDEKKTGARPGVSAPSVPGGSKKSRNMMDRFTDAVNAEETTAQKQLEVKRARVDLQKATAIARIQAQTKLQMSKDQLRADLKREKLRMEHEFRMAQIPGTIINSHGPLAPSLPPRSSFSNPGPSLGNPGPSQSLFSNPRLSQPSSSFTSAAPHHHSHSTPESVSTGFDSADPFDHSSFSFDMSETGPQLKLMLPDDLAHE